jgi:flagellar motor switch protein FliM
VVVVSSFHVELDGGGGELHITIPYSMIEPIREMLDAGLQSDSDERDDRWVNSLREDIMQANVNLDTKFVESKILLRDIIDLKNGDVIPIELPDEYTTNANGVPMFKVNIGQANGNLALKVNEVIERPKSNAMSPLLKLAEAQAKRDE